MKTKILITAMAFSLFGISNLQAQEKKDAHKSHDHATVEADKFACSMKCEGDKTYAEAGECPKCGMQLTKMEPSSATKAYACPMKCEGDKTYTEAGDCPKCSMALVEQKTKPAKAHDSHEGHDH